MSVTFTIKTILWTPGKRPSHRQVIVNGIKVADVESKRDYVKAKPTDAIRTKMASVNTVRWCWKGLELWLGRSIDSGKLMRLTLRDLRDYELRPYVGSALQRFKDGKETDVY